MIAFLTTFGLFAASPYNLPVQNSVSITMNQDSSSDFQFQVVAPDEVFLPFSGETKEFKIGLKITNNTSKPKYFCLCPMEPEIVDENDITLKKSPPKFTGERLLNLTNYSKKISPKRSLIFYMNVSIKNWNRQKDVFFDNGYTIQNVSPGKFRLYISYYSYYSEKVAEMTQSENSEQLEIKNLWTGKIKTSAKDIVFLR
jgi:hypothetical protein